jgi:hypothetical protein
MSPQRQYGNDGAFANDRALAKKMGEAAFALAT